MQGRQPSLNRWALSEGFAYVKKDGKYGYIDATGNLIVACERGMLPGVFSEGRASVITLEGKRVMIETHGSIVIK